MIVLDVVLGVAGLAAGGYLCWATLEFVRGWRGESRVITEREASENSAPLSNAIVSVKRVDH